MAITSKARTKPKANRAAPERAIRRKSHGSQGVLREPGEAVIGGSNRALARQVARDFKIDPSVVRSVMRRCADLPDEHPMVWLARFEVIERARARDAARVSR